MRTRRHGQQGAQASLAELGHRLGVGGLGGTSSLRALHGETEIVLKTERDEPEVDLLVKSANEAATLAELSGSTAGQINGPGIRAGAVPPGSVSAGSFAA